jgi:hypothetical protein
MIGDGLGVLPDRPRIRKTDVTGKEAPKPLVDLHGIQAFGIISKVILGAVAFSLFIKETFPGGIFPGAGPDPEIRAQISRNRKGNHQTVLKNILIPSPPIQPDQRLSIRKVLNQNRISLSNVPDRNLFLDNL